VLQPHEIVFHAHGQKTSLSYGDGGIVSDATSDGYGIVPMPGITDANIRTKSAYGSLREAKVNFVCHNQRQLEVLEMLYMRPGYAVLLEWGWSPYVNNNGKLVNEFKTVENDISSEVLFSNKVTQQKVFNSINRLKESSFGNYDGLLGYIKNFGFQARPDGGFDCFVELISIGEVLDSIKTTNVNKINNLDPNQSLTDDNGLMGLVKGLNLYDSEPATVTSFYNEKFGNFFGPVAKFVSNFSTVGIITNTILETSAQVYNKAVNSATNDFQKILATSLGLKDSLELKNFIFKVKNNNSATFENRVGFIRWDALCSLLNYQFIPKDSNEDALFFISPDKVHIKNDKIYIEPILYTPYNSSDGLIDVSCDPNICILPNQLNYYDQNNLAAQVQNALGSIPRVEVWAPLSSLGPFLGSDRIRDIIYNSYLGEKSLNEEKEMWGENLLDFNDSYRRIGNIFISINMLYELALNNKDNLDYTLGQFVKDIWGKINQACPNHNFQVIDNANSPIINIIDLGVSNSDIPLLNDLYEITPFSNENTLRNFNFESQVPSSLTSTIAIQSQNPRSVENIEDVTFIAFNRSIKNRLIHDDTTSTVDTIEALSQLEAELLTGTTGNPLSSVELGNLWLSISEYIENFWNYIKEEPENNQISIKNISGNLKRYQALIETSKIKKEENTSSAAVIPLSFNATMDGISGIVIGNVFKIQKDRLPKAYKKANIGFIVFGEEQNINAGQDWETKINGKMIILPTKNVKITQVQPLDQSFNYAIQAEAMKDVQKAFVASTTSTAAVVAPQVAQVQAVINNQAANSIAVRAAELEKQINPKTSQNYTPFEAELRAKLEISNEASMLMPNGTFTLFNRNPFSAGAYIIVNDLPPLPNP
jgi:hypothetical protein